MHSARKRVCAQRIRLGLLKLASPEETLVRTIIAENAGLAKRGVDSMFWPIYACRPHGGECRVSTMRVGAISRGSLLIARGETACGLRLRPVPEDLSSNSEGIRWRCVGILNCLLERTRLRTPSTTCLPSSRENPPGSMGGKVLVGTLGRFAVDGSLDVRFRAASHVRVWRAGDCKSTRTHSGQREHRVWRCTSGQ